MDSSLTGLLSSLQTSFSAAILPPDANISPPQNGISLLDVKNELFLSYLQNLVFLILIKLRHLSPESIRDEDDDIPRLNEDVTKKLVELRLYLEKGVRPLEARLKYQIDKVVKAAEDVTQTPTTNGVAKIDKKDKKKRMKEDGDSQSGLGSSSEDDGDSDASEEIDDLSYRPNPAALLRPSAGVAARGKADEITDGIYRPPRITATSMPTTKGKEERAERRPAKSATLDEFVTSELSTAPMAEPSIGSTIVSGGRRMKTQRERDDDANRTRYEEENLIRLPKESKKEKKRGGMDRNGGYGGEEWRDLGSGLDRIERLVKRKDGSGGKLDQSRKRKIDVGDGPRDSGAAAGTEFAKQKKKIMKRFR